tara:strand:+ start:9181 stop:10302 length:1122 start_codon:yes stop_codon:yes gene_type:complete
MPHRTIQTSTTKCNKSIAIIGAGVVGSMTAFQLVKLGHDVSLIEPRFNKAFQPATKLNATEASLGVLMGHIYRKTSGRSWRLRKRSMEIWPELLMEISKYSLHLKIETPLIQLGNSEIERSLMKELANKKKIFGIKLLDKQTTSQISEIFNTNIEAALISENDGRINPKRLLISLMKALHVYQVKKIDQSVISLKKKSGLTDKQWKIYLSNNEILEKDYVVICASLGSEEILTPLDHIIRFEPKLGQVLDLRIDIQNNNKFVWPAVINTKGYNFILNNKNEHQMLLGATMENGISPNIEHLNIMKDCINSDWGKKALVEKQWYGIRSRPMNEPSPIIKNLEPGLLVNTGHYRNGILLAPACAEWIVQQITENL